tara:strand:+ start:6125 stop:6574 length:450 start_codon:yes stop_codon:yes gene_type:complete
MDYTAKAAIMVAADPNTCYEAFADPDRITRFWFPRVSGPIEPDAHLTWHVGHADDAMGIDVDVVSARPGIGFDIRWGTGDAKTEVSWSFHEKGPLTEIRVTETGFQGDDETRISKALDSTGGFNQVLVAAKALIEHGVDVNVVDSRAPN